MDKENKTTIKEKKAAGGKSADVSALNRRLEELTAALNEAKTKKILPEEPKAPLWKRITNGIIWGVLCALFAVLLLITVVAAVSRAKGENVSFMGFSVYTVVTGSMEPEIMIGDIVIVRKVPQAEIKIGDNITFLRGDMVITHKVMKTTENGFITQGVANNTADSEVPYTSVYGKVIFKSTVIGAIYEIVGSPYGFLFVIVVPLFLFVIYETWALTKKFKALKAADGDDPDKGVSAIEESTPQKAEPAVIEDKSIETVAEKPAADINESPYETIDGEESKAKPEAAEAAKPVVKTKETQPGIQVIKSKPRTAAPKKPSGTGTSQSKPKKKAGEVSALKKKLSGGSSSKAKK